MSLKVPRFLFLAAFAVVAVAADGPSRASSSPQDAVALEDAYRQAFEDDLTPTDRVAALERIVKEHPESRWADDALWALGEAARQQQLSRRVIYYWQYMMGRVMQPRLEPYTRTLPLYRTSSLRRAEYLLEVEGAAFQQPKPRDDGKEQDGRELRQAPSVVKAGGRVFLDCRPFNPVPMVVWGELGARYERLGRLRLALSSYQRAAARAPETGRWAADFRVRVEGLQQRLKTLFPDDYADYAGTPAPMDPALSQALPGGEQTAPAEAADDQRQEGPQDAPDQKPRT